MREASFSNYRLIAFLTIPSSSLSVAMGHTHRLRFPIIKRLNPFGIEANKSLSSWGSQMTLFSLSPVASGLFASGLAQLCPLAYLSAIKA